MSSVYEEMAADKVGVQLGASKGFDLTTSAIKINLYDSGGSPILPAADGRIIMLASTVTLAYAYAKDNTTDVSYIANTGGQTGMVLFAGVPEEHVPRGPWLLIQATGAGRLWIAVTSTKTRNSK